jgi:hypothetical protein
VLEERASSTLFPMRSELVFAKNADCNLGVSRWRLALFPPISLFR